ncbi:hypothetical protein Bint_0615 [Brachyspira intermedia PWS/A]|uniref:Uncharacterized protein n=1 Tax=Brachyspira intermedia (strain ATCC 51140 / PWS/A) TaxID=1045858 RepID=G0EJX5_BRAIP|nr:hypothetical protein Bint_0615 [Brachyspira intermedia PWS/A]
MILSYGFLEQENTNNNDTEIIKYNKIFFIFIVPLNYPNIMLINIILYLNILSNYFIDKVIIFYFFNYYTVYII